MRVFAEIFSQRPSLILMVDFYEYFFKDLSVPSKSGFFKKNVQGFPNHFSPPTNVQPEKLIF